MGCRESEQLPVLLGEREERVDVVADAIDDLGRRAPEDQVGDTLRVPRGIGDGERSRIDLGTEHHARLGDAFDDGVEVAIQRVERERRDGALGEPEPSRVVLHESVPARQPLEPAALAGLLPLELEVAGGKRRHPDDDTAPSPSRIGDADAIRSGRVLHATQHAGTIAASVAQRLGYFGPGDEGEAVSYAGTEFCPAASRHGHQASAKISTVVSVLRGGTLTDSIGRSVALAGASSAATSLASSSSTAARS